jgi:hypothetical protein
MKRVTISMPPDLGEKVDKRVSDLDLDACKYFRTLARADLADGILGPLPDGKSRARLSVKRGSKHSTAK